MAYEIPGFMLGTIQANQSFEAKATFEFTAVDVAAASGSGLTGAAIVPPASAGVQAIGILQNLPKIGEAATVMVGGVSKAQLGATLATVGVKLMADTDGQLILATSGNYVIARLLEAGVAGDVVAVLLLPGGKL